MGEDAANNAAPAAATEIADEGGAVNDLWAPLPLDEGEQAAESAEAAAAIETEAPAEAAKPVDKPTLSEAELKAAALKYANGTMAAARRAERAIASTKAENERLKGAAQAAAQELEAFKVEFKKNPFGAVRKLGYAGIKEFVDAAIDVGEGKPETADDRVARIEQQLASERAERLKLEQASNHEAAKTRVQAALVALPAKYDVTVNTDLGKAAVWEGIVEYSKLHGFVPDAVVFRIADGVEADLGRAKRFQSASPASTGKPTPSTATGASTRGKTITNASTGGAPVAKEYSLDWDEGRRQIDADMRAAGEI